VINQENVYEQPIFCKKAKEISTVSRKHLHHESISIFPWYKAYSEEEGWQLKPLM
jgi:hypothetical protein